MALADALALAPNHGRTLHHLCLDHNLVTDVCGLALVRVRFQITRVSEHVINAAESHVLDQVKSARDPVAERMSELGPSEPNGLQPIGSEQLASGFPAVVERASATASGWTQSESTPLESQQSQPRPELVISAAGCWLSQPVAEQLRGSLQQPARRQQARGRARGHKRSQTRVRD